MDKHIIKEFKNLKNDIKPRQEWVSSSRDLLLSQIKTEKQEATTVGAVEYVNVFLGMFRNTLLEPAVMMLLILVTFLGSSLTINAAFYSLPGDNLYNVKLTLEKTHVALVQDDSKKLELKMEFAQKRMAEFDKIVAQSDVTAEERKKQIETVVQEFKNNVASVNTSLAKIKDDNGDANQVRMAAGVVAQTEELAKEVTEKIADLPEAEKAEVEEIVAQAVAEVLEVGEAAQDLVDEAASEEEDTEEAVEEEVTEEETTDEIQTTDELDNTNAQESQGDTSDQGTETADKVLE